MRTLKLPRCIYLPIPERGSLRTRLLICHVPTWSIQSATTQERAHIQLDAHGFLQRVVTRQRVSEIDLKPASGRDGIMLTILSEWRLQFYTQLSHCDNMTIRMSCDNTDNPSVTLVNVLIPYLQCRGHDATLDQPKHGMRYLQHHHPLAEHEHGSSDLVSCLDTI